MKKITCNKTCDIYVDSEWDSQTKFLSVQIKYKHTVILYYNNKYKIPQTEKFQKSHGLEIFWQAWDFSSNEWIIENFLTKFKIQEEKIKIHFYYSIVDLYALFKEDFILTLLSPISRYKNAIFKQTNIRGHFTILDRQFEIKDLSGWVRDGLGKSLNMVGYDSTYKNQSVIEKSKMETMMETKEKKETFFKYALEDVVSLEFLQKNMLDKINYLYEKIYHFPKDFLITDETLPQTMGSVGAQLLDKFIYFKMSLDEKGHFSEKYFQFFDEINQKMGTRKRKLKGTYNVKKRMAKNRYSPQEQELLNGTSIKTIARNYAENTGVLNAIVQGGRAIREDRNVSTHEYLVDIDFVSCYSTGIKEFHYPIGLPTIEARTEQDEPITLRTFLKENKDELMENLFTITISNPKLTFEQDLLYSKQTNAKELRKKINAKLDAEECLKNNTLDSNFLLYKKQLKNSILTSDLINALKKICTNKEWAEILNSKVETACYYKKSDFLTLEEWRKHFEVSKNLGEYNFLKKGQSNYDKRSRKWTTIALDEIIEPLLKERQIWKTKSKEASDPNDKEKFNNQQLFYKNIGNIIYGVIASMYFSTSNVVVANVITARARLNIWMVSKTLLTKQSITDGGIYSVLTTVEIQKGKKPGLDKLSKIHQFKEFKKTRKGKDNININIKPLGGKTEEEWKRIFLEKNQIELGKLDEQATKALEQMWKEIYNLKLNYAIEHKQSNTSFKAFTMNKAHYALQTLDEKEIFKFRGQNEKVANLYKEIAKTKMTGQDTIMDFETFQKLYYYEEKSIQSINEYLIEKEIKEQNTVVIPGREKIKIKKFNLKCQDILFDNEKIADKVKKESLDFSQKKYAQYEINKDPISINSFFEEIHTEKTTYLNTL